MRTPKITEKELQELLEKVNKELGKDVVKLGKFSALIEREDPVKVYQRQVRELTERLKEEGMER